MDLLPLKLVIVFIAYLVYDPRSCSTDKESPILYTKKTLALYKKLKQEPDTFLDRLNMTVAEGDLKPKSGNMNNNDVKVMLFDQGYLKVKTKPEEPGGLCKLELPRNSEMWLYKNLVNAAKQEDRVVADGISNIKTIFQRIPPEIEDFKSLMHSLESVLCRIPRLFNEWELAAMFGIFNSSDLEVFVGRGPDDLQIIYCQDLPNDTCMRFIVDFHDNNATYRWDSYYRDLLLPGLLDLDVYRKHLLAGIASFFSYKHDNNIIRDWYAQYESPTRLTIREYRP